MAKPNFILLLSLSQYVQVINQNPVQEKNRCSIISIP